MPKLYLLTTEKDEYRKRIEQANLTNLEFTDQPADCDIVLGEPRLIRDELPHLSQVKWIQSMYAGVETLTGSGQRQDYILTNARGVFGELMSEYVFGYLLAHEKKIFTRHAIATKQ